LLQFDTVIWLPMPCFKLTSFFTLLCINTSFCTNNYNGYYVLILYYYYCYYYYYYYTTTAAAAFAAATFLRPLYIKKPKYLDKNALYNHEEQLAVFSLNSCTRTCNSANSATRPTVENI